MIETFDRMLADARTAFEQGDLERASDLASAAEALARDAGDGDRADRGLCSHCWYEIQLDRGGDKIALLKQVLLRTSCPTNRFLASYYTAVAYDLADDVERAYSYASRAHELAQKLDDPQWLAGSANLAGNLAIRESNFSRAEKHFRQALGSFPLSDDFQRIMAAQIKDNIGYVQLCAGHLEDGVQLCEEALAELEELAADHYLHTVLQDLCYGHLMNDRLERAQQCGERALQLAIEQNDEPVAKNCLFLLSETAVRRGDSFTARRLLRELVDHYPEIGISDEIVEVFLSTDLTTVVNLRG
jgi:tetratricopeptide (TPR) repeat protein